MNRARAIDRCITPVEFAPERVMILATSDGTRLPVAAGPRSSKNPPSSPPVRSPGGDERDRLSATVQSLINWELLGRYHRRTTRGNGGGCRGCTSTQSRAEARGVLAGSAGDPDHRDRRP